ncbi:TonB-dependent receptor [Lentisalinibacter salinarum]|uniref:TonB-dependent receptor n=1 Tax=Lentisalinibacter salinarum TaxID=2992239 RepID=UPI003866364C
MRTTRTAIFGATAMLALGGSALAAEGAAGQSAGDVDAYDIEEIVVTASRREQSAFDEPFMINARGMEELQSVRQVRTIPDALRDLPGIMIQKTAHGQGSPYIRGFTGLRTLFLIDGIRLNNSIFREGPNQYWNTVDPLSAYRLEVVKGPTSVLYGSDAIGGTVNAISRSYRDTADAGAPGGSRTRLYARGATAENSVVLRPEIGYAGERFDVIAAVTLKDFGDMEGGSDVGEQEKTGYEERNGELKLYFDLAENQQLVAGLQSVDQDDAWRSHRTVFGFSWEGTTIGNELRRSLDQKRVLGYLQYRAQDLAPWAEELTLSLSHHAQEEERFRIRSDGRIDIQGVDVGTTGLFGNLIIPSSLGTLTTGLEFYRDDVDSYRTDYNADGTVRAVRIQGPVADDATYDTAAAFVQDQIAVADGTDLILGLRYTRAEADAGRVEDPLTGDPTSISDSWDALTASARFTHRLGAAGRARLFGGISQGFRAPNLSDITRLDTARSNEIETPVRDLDSEQFLNYELGLKWVDEHWSGQAAVFYTDIEDMIIRTPTGEIIAGNNEVTKRNSGAGYVQGIEAQARYRLDDQWSVFGNFTWLDGEVDTFPTSDASPVREPIDRLMPVTAHAGVHWQPAGAPWWLEGQVSYAGEADDLSSRDAGDTDRIPPGGTPDYAVFTLRGGWELSQSVRLSLALENLTDEDYRVHGSGVNEPGRNLVLSVFWQPM